MIEKKKKKNSTNSEIIKMPLLLMILPYLSRVYIFLSLNIINKWPKHVLFENNNFQISEL